MLYPVIEHLQRVLMGTRPHLTQLTLGRLPHVEVDTMVQRLTGNKPLLPEVVAQVIAWTDGVPLFVEELIRMLLESNLVGEAADGYGQTGPPPSLTIPATLQDSLMGRLDRFPSARAAAQLGAVLGREFGDELIHEVALMDEATLQRGLAQLVATELLYQRGIPPQATYLFKHALIQEVAYQSLLKSTRQRFHQRIAEALESQFPASAESQPELVAQHYTAAGCHKQAVVSWQRAGQRAAERSAIAEAMNHFMQGLELLTILPDTPERAQQEFVLGLDLWRLYFSQSRLEKARALADQCLILAQRLGRLATPPGSMHGARVDVAPPGRTRRRSGLLGARDCPLVSPAMPHTRLQPWERSRGRVPRALHLDPVDPRFCRASLEEEPGGARPRP